MDHMLTTSKNTLPGPAELLALLGNPPVTSLHNRYNKEATVKEMSILLSSSSSPLEDTGSVG